MNQNRDPKFYGEFKRLNDDLLKVFEANQKISPYFDYTPTFQDYIRQIDELKKQFPFLPVNHYETKIFSAPPNDFSRTLNDTNKSINESRANDTKNEDDEDGPPPEPNVEMYDEPDAKFKVRCKLYERVVVRGGSISVQLRGCGVLFVKGFDNNPSKLHVIMRQDPDLMRVLLNQVITKHIPVKRATRCVQLMVPGDEEGETKFFIAKVKDDQSANQLFELLNSVKT